MKFQDFNICPKILQVDGDRDADAENGVYSCNSLSALKCSPTKNGNALQISYNVRHKAEMQEKIGGFSA